MQKTAPKPGRVFSAEEKTWILDFQFAAGAKSDGIIGRQTLWHIRDALRRRQAKVDAPTDQTLAICVFAALGFAIGFALAMVIAT